MSCCGCLSVTSDVAEMIVRAIVVLVHHGNWEEMRGGMGEGKEGRE